MRWIGLAVVLGALGLAAAPASAVTVTQFTQGLGAATTPDAPAGGPDGNVWFTDDGAGAVGRITPAGAITQFTQGIPAGDLPYDSITAGADGAMWFCLKGAAPAIGRIDPATGAITFFQVAANPQGVVLGPDGNVWFFEHAAIGFVTPKGTVTQITTGFSNLSPSVEAIAPGPDGNVWFLDNGNNYSVGHVNVLTHALSESASGIDPTRVLSNITAGPDGNMWFTSSGGAIGRVTLPAGAVSETLAGSGGLQPNASPDEIMPGPDGNVWFDDQLNAKDAIGRITPATGAITEFPLKTPTTPWTMTFGYDGNIYAAQTGLVMRMTASGAITEFPTASATAGADNDSMLQGPDGNVYYNDMGTPKSIVQVSLDLAPTATTGAATAVGPSSATVPGTVTPLGADTTVTVRYGTTPALGSSVAAGTLHPGTAAVTIGATLGSLPASTTVYYAVVATNAHGTATGATRSFRTAAPPAATVTGRLGNQLLALSAPTTQACIGGAGTVDASFTSASGRSGARLRLLGVTFSIDRGIRHTHRVRVRRHGRLRTVTLVTYTPNATARRSPAVVSLGLAGLSPGIHTLNVVATYRDAHGRRQTRRLSTRFAVC